MNGLGAAHPGFRANTSDQFGEARDKAEILADVLFTDQAHRDDATTGYGDRGAEEALQHEDAFGVVAQCAMPKVRGDGLGLVEPLMQWQIVFGLGRPISLRRKAHGDSSDQSSPPVRRCAGCIRTSRSARCSRA